MAQVNYIAINQHFIFYTFSKMACVIYIVPAFHTLLVTQGNNLSNCISIIVIQWQGWLMIQSVGVNAKSRPWTKTPRHVGGWYFRSIRAHGNCLADIGSNLIKGNLSPAHDQRGARITLLPQLLVCFADKCVACVCHENNTATSVPVDPNSYVICCILLREKSPQSLV